ncbi:GTP-binding protein [Synechococcus sp. H65.1]|uniref:GTP-binding protein n=1 Tax=unclassified Synechococcus TaxID=2626047 RepID=UPI0039C41384
MKAQLPVTILTGFWGRGKTPLLRRLLQEEGLGSGVIRNELGGISLEGNLAHLAAGALLQLSNGCLWGRVRQDLEGAAGELPPPAQALDYRVADPRHATELFVQKTFRPELRLAAVVTLGHGAKYWRNFQRSQTVAHQISGADLLLLNKADGITAAELDLRRYNSAVSCLLTTPVPLARILEVHAFCPELWNPQLSAAEAEAHAYPSHRLAPDGSQSLSFQLQQPLGDWRQEVPETLVCAKGVLGWGGRATAGYVSPAGLSADPLVGVSRGSPGAAPVQKGLHWQGARPGSPGRRPQAGVPLNRHLPISFGRGEWP